MDGGVDGVEPLSRADLEMLVRLRRSGFRAEHIFNPDGTLGATYYLRQWANGPRDALLLYPDEAQVYRSYDEVNDLDPLHANTNALNGWLRGDVRTLVHKLLTMPEPRPRRGYPRPAPPSGWTPPGHQ